MKTLIGYDVTNGTKQEVVYDAEIGYVGCEAYDWAYDIGEDEEYKTVQDFIDYATNDGWFEAA